jgi:hypothetical protein
VPVFVYDPEGRLPATSSCIHLSMADNDSFYLASPEFPYVT